MKKQTLGVSLFALSCFISVVINAISKYTLQVYGVHPLILLAGRYVFMAIFWLPFAIQDKFTFLRLKSAPQLLRRDVISIFCMIIWYYYSPLIPMNNATIISFTTPIFAILIWSLKTKRMPSVNLLTALVASLVGVAISAGGTGGNAANFAYIALLGFAIARGFVNVMSKSIPNEQTTARVFQSNAMISLIFAIGIFICMLDRMQIWNPAVMYVVFVSFLLHLIYYSTFTYGIRHSDMEVAQPFDFLRIVFSSVLSWAVFSEPLTLNVAIGSIIIIASVYFTTKRKSVV